MRKTILALSLCLALLCPTVQGAENYDQYLAFGYQASSALKFVALEDCQIRALYQISLPQDDTVAVDQAIVDEYGRCETVYLLDVGYSLITPILLSEFCCVGVLADGEMVALKTPADILAQTFDTRIFEPLIIERLA